MTGVGQLVFRQLDSNGTARVGGGHRGMNEIRSFTRKYHPNYPIMIMVDVTHISRHD